MEIKGDLFQVFVAMPQDCQDFWFWRKLVHIKEVFISVVEFLLKNARVLEKMVIAKPQDIQNQRHMLHDFLEVAQELLSIPRSSPHVVIMFQYQ